MNTNPSYGTGFARNKDESAFPELWDGLVGAWPFSLGVTGSDIPDLSGKNNPGDAAAGDAPVSWVPGKFGPALDFSPDEKMEVADSPNMSGLSAVSVSIWMRWEAQSDSYPLLIGKSNYSGDREYRIRFETASTMVWQVSNDGNDPGAAETTFNTSLLTVGKWHHVAATYDGATLWFYLDGDEVDSNAGEAGPLHDGPAAFRVGGFDNTDFWTGQLDMPAVWDRCLAADQVRTLFRFPKALFVPRRKPFGFAAGGTIYTQSITATTAPAASLSDRQTNKGITATTAPAASLSDRQTNKGITATSAPAGIVSSVTQKAIAATGTGAAASPSTQTNKDIDAATAPVITLQKQTNIIITTTTVPSASINRQTNKAIAAVGTGAAASAQSLQSATQSVTASTIPAAAISILTLRLVDATTAPVPLVNRKTNKSISTVAIGVALASSTRLVLVEAIATGVAGSSRTEITDISNISDRRMGRKSPKVVNIMSDVGLYQYIDEPFGVLRNSEKDTTYAWWHDSITKPADPLRRPAHSYLFGRDIDVSSDRFSQGASGSGTVLTVQNRRSGWAKFINGSGDNEYYYYVAVNEIAAMAPGKHIWFDTEIEITDVQKADMFVGLCSKLSSGNLFDNRVDCIGFTLANGGADLQYVASKNGTGGPADTGVVLSSLTSVKLSFVATNLTRVDFHVNDRYVANLKTNLPNDEAMAVAFGLRNGEASPNAMSITTTTVLLD